ncbi:MAG: trimethylamine methyltransferase family protein [Tateyamaria sp.]|uniref:trimethylamine methyltransferase family protein n=1 Tax=Tateyamaria sp. TaxID=1929288 RepID=UPI00329E0F59
MYNTSLRLLAVLGMGKIPDRLRAKLEAAGATSTSTGRVALHRVLVKEAIDHAPKTFPLHGRGPARTIKVGETSVHFVTGGAAVQTLHGAMRAYRASTLTDLHDFTRLQDTLLNVSWLTRSCIATDLADESTLDAQTA